MSGHDGAGRWLARAEKRRVVAAWERRVLAFVEAGAPWRPGDPDLEMVPWCARFNALDGVCTLQSCAGHEADGGGAGHLWLKLSRRAAGRVLRLGPELELLPGVDHVGLLWREGEEVLEVGFRRHERDDACRALLAALGGLEHDEGGGE